MISPSSKYCSFMVFGLAVQLCGCVVGQPPGHGRVFYLTEAKTGNGYYLYLPEDYIESEGLRPPDKKWPIVVSFHGMRPWDSAGAQIMEWQQEADRYGFVVLAPDTRVSDMLGELPLRRVSHSLKKDEEATLAILDEMYETLDVDPNHVLTTSWSMGGYLAHYMINRHPDRFSCLAVRQSNFSAEILDAAQVSKYRDSKIAVFYTQNDFDICRRESVQAISWYTEHGFDTTSGIVESMGHERTPQIAAAFFAKTCAALAKTPPRELAQIRLKPVPSAQIASARRNGKGSAARPSWSSGGTVPQLARANAADTKTPWQETRTTPPRRRDLTAAASGSPGIAARRAESRNLPSGRAANPSTTPRKRIPVTRRAASKPLPARPIPRSSTGKHADNSARRFARAQGNTELNPLRIRLSAHIGISPMLMSYTVHIPPTMRKGADVLWIDNGEPISKGISGQKTLVEPGQHKIEVLVVTEDNREFRANKTITVLERLVLDDDGKG